MLQTHNTAKCFIQELRNAQGEVSIELCEKVTGRRVALGMTTSDTDRDHFLKFLNAAAGHKAQMPSVFSKDDKTDHIVVSGDLDFDAPDEIRFTHNEELSYHFA